MSNWIEWEATENSHEEPVDGDTEVEVMYVNGSTENWHAGDIDWSSMIHGDESFVISKYRIVDKKFKLKINDIPESNEYGEFGMCGNVNCGELSCDNCRFDIGGYEALHFGCATSMNIAFNMADEFEEKEEFLEKLYEKYPHAFPDGYIGNSKTYNDIDELSEELGSGENVVKSKYDRLIVDKYDKTKSIIGDVYSVLEAFEVTCSALQHLNKKGLCAGLRGHKDVMQDLIDIRDSADEAIRLQEAREYWKND